MLRLQVLRVTVALSIASLGAAWETTAEAARQARALLEPRHGGNFGVGTLSSIYPDSFYIPALRGRVASGPEYFAPCYDNGDLVLLALTVSQNWKNILPSYNGSNATLTIGANPDPAWPDPRHAQPVKRQPSHHNHQDEELRWDPHRPAWRRGMPSKNRITLFGSIEELSSPSSSSSSASQTATAAKPAARCFLSHHPDAAHWAPGAPDSPHTALWVRFRVEAVYSIGGYGDEHAIRFLPLDEYQRAGRAQLGLARLDARDDDVRVDKHLFFGVNADREERIEDEPMLRFQRLIP